MARDVIDERHNSEGWNENEWKAARAKEDRKSCPTCGSTEYHEKYIPEHGIFSCWTCGTPYTPEGED